MAGTATAAGAPAAGIVRNRWTQLVVGIFTMVMIANLQYGWTLFVDPINEKMNFGRPFIVGLLSTFILFETWLVPFEAYLVDRFGPRLLVIVGALLLRVPRKGEVPESAAAPTVRQTTRDYTPLQTIKTPVFWLMYLMMTLIGVGGLMATGVLASVAKDLGVDKSNVNLGFAAIAVVPFALSLDRILNGVTRPFWGWVSDHIGRERTMTLAFGLEACAILVFLLTWDNPLLFAICSGLAFFGYGEIYSLFPATSADLFGRSFATTNYGLLYTSKGLASLLIPVGAVIQSVTNSWTPVFATAVVFDLIAATLALTLLRRLATAHLARAAMPEQAPAFVPAVAGGSE